VFLVDKKIYQLVK